MLNGFWNFDGDDGNANGEEFQKVLVFAQTCEFSEQVHPPRINSTSCVDNNQRADGGLEDVRRRGSGMLTIQCQNVSMIISNGDQRAMMAMMAKEQRCSRPFSRCCLWSSYATAVASVATLCCPLSSRSPCDDNNDDDDDQ